MDFHFNKGEAEDGVLDFHRFVLIVNHSFSPRIRFVGELELEHAFVEGLEERGELELEQAYVDFLLSASFNVRAGMLLVPMGIINERHEPPVYHGVERPFVDTVIIPTTWFETGAGMFGEVRPRLPVSRVRRWRRSTRSSSRPTKVFATAGRKARGRTSATWPTRDAWSTSAFAGLTLGASAWSGKSSFARAAAGRARSRRRG